MQPRGAAPLTAFRSFLGPLGPKGAEEASRSCLSYWGVGKQRGAPLNRGALSRHPPPLPVSAKIIMTFN